MNYDYAKVKDICTENIIYKILECENENDLPLNYSSIFEYICAIFKAVPPELIQAPFSVYLNNNYNLEKQFDIHYVSELQDIEYKDAHIVFLDKNRFIIAYEEIDFTGMNVFRYTFQGKQSEYFEINSKRIQVLDYIDQTMYSVFSCPTYSDIQEALQVYRNKFAQYSTCYILNDVWANQTKQVLKNKPECYFQKSLSQFLNTHLRGYTVKREQVVDDSHPVDIKATGPTLDTVSLIEIKWIGKSLSVSYTDARANAGAAQLIGYLGASKAREPNIHFKGYLTVFDARRKTNDRDHYAHVGIEYKQEYLNCSEIELERFYLYE